MIGNRIIYTLLKAVSVSNPGGTEKKQSVVKIFVRLHGGVLSIEKYSDEKAMTDVFFKRLQVQLIQKIEGIFKWIFFQNCRALGA